jgi:hypothetical protein
MAAQKRIYSVASDVGIFELVKAATRAQALAHVTRKRFVVQVATQDALVAALQDGIKVEEVP